MAKKIIPYVGSIQITEVPDGMAPEWVRKHWLGRVLPVVGLEHSTETVYMVLQSEALLRLESQRSLNWWSSLGFPEHKDACFGFKLNHARIVEPLKPVPVGVRQFVGLEEVGVGAHDHPANQ